MDDPLASEVRDPATTSGRLAEIAAARPDLGRVVAMHPNAYSGLLDWLDAFGDPAARAAVRDVRAGGTAHTAPTVSDPEIPQTDPFASRPTPVDGTPRPKRRTGVIVGIAAGLVVLLAGGGAAAFAVFAVRGANSPEAAAEKVLHAAASFDAMGLLTGVAPSEVRHLRSAIETTGSVDTGGGGSDGSTSYFELVGQLKSSLTVAIDGAEYESEELAEGVVAIEMVAGTITIDGDPEGMAEFVAGVSGRVLGAYLEGTGGGDVDVETEHLREQVATWWAAESPLTFDVQEYRTGEYAAPLTLVAVDEGGWYISPLMSYGEAMYRQAARTLPELADRGNRVVEAEHFASPEAAAEGLAAAAVDFVRRGDTDSLAAALPLAERRLVSTYGPVVAPSFQRGGVDAELTEARFDAKVDGDRAQVEIDQLTLDLADSLDEWSYRFSQRGTCWDWHREYTASEWNEYWETWNDYQAADEGSACLADYLGRETLGLDDATLVAVREGGSWHVSALATVGTAASVAADRIAELAESSDLREVWQR